MAEFALGLTKTAVEGTLSLVKSAVEEEKQLRDKVQNDLVFITAEFEVMQSFLQAANREHAANDKVALALVRQLRTLAFDVEDCIEYVIHLDKSSRWGWLQRVWNTVYCRAPRLPLDVAVDEIKQLKARVEDVSQRNTRYNLILHGSDKIIKHQQQQPFTIMPLPAEEALYATTATYNPSPTVFHVLRDAWEATGKWRNNVYNLQQELLITPEGEDDHELQVISVWGSSSNTGGSGADLGTASIFRKAYRDPKIYENFKVCAWVKLTRPFNKDEFVKSLLTQFVASSQQSNADVCFWTKIKDFWTRMKVEVTHQDNYIKANAKIKQQMREQRFLVVLEDVFTLEEWNVIRMYLPNSKNGSRILLSTPQLGIALTCTGEPYQVSELKMFPGHNQFLCAFNNKTPRGIGEFDCQLLRRCGVISVWGPDDADKSNLIDILYRGIINGWLNEICGVVDELDHVDMLYKGIRNRRRKFEGRHSSWVDVPDPFNLKVFAQRLFLNFHSDDIQADEITKVGMKGETGLIEWCHRFLSEEKDYPYIVIINGVQSKGVWDLIQSTFLSSEATRAKGCILVITNEETVATHCVKDHTHLAFNAKDLKADPSISTLINKGCWHYAFSGKRGRLFYDRRKDAREWASKFENVGGITPDEGFRVFTVTGDENSIKGVLRHAYYGALFQQQIEVRSSWVVVPYRVTDMKLRDFSWRLLLDFYSDDPQAKEQVAVGLMEGTIIDPIEKCREILRKEKCLVVIYYLLSIPAWECIMSNLFSEQHNIQCIIVVGDIMSGAVEDYLYNTQEALRLGTQEQGRLIDMEYRSIFSTQKRYQDAIQWAETHQPIGRDREMDHIKHLLGNNNLVTIWGIPGVGKSTLVRSIYYNSILDSSNLYESSWRFHPYEAFAWVDVPSPFNLTEFAWRLLLDFYSDDPQAKETATVSIVEEGHQIPILECCKILRNGECLVVMDGLRSKQDWDLIKATFLAEPLNEGTAIVVITTEEELAMHCTENNNGRAINITRLEANAALSLLEKIVWKGKGLTSRETEISKLIIAKCGGLPKVIASIGEMCTPHRWRLNDLYDNFMGTLETNPEFHGLRHLFSWMQSYFDACSDSIKPCIFYLSIFSAEKNIRRRRLLWRWIAEGYCRDTSEGRTCEENWKIYFSELVKLSIIQQSPSNEVFCQINGFFHEYIISRPMEDNLVFALEGHCSLNSQRAGQHLTTRNSWDRNETVYESIDFSRLRSLTVSGKWESFFISSKKVNMRLLRVLDLEDAEGVTNEDLEQIAKLLLTRLKFLSIRSCREITCLPSSMGCMRQLQTLDIRHTSIETLPIFITKLQKLRYIRAGTTEVWDWEGDVVAADGEGDRASSSAQVVTNLTPPAVATTPTEGGTDSTVLALPANIAGSSVPVACNNKPCTLISSFLSKLCRRCSCGHENIGPATGVTVLAGIGNLPVLHTLGVVKVNGQCGKDICKALKQLTQLRKLGVSGINKGNIQEFCSAISGLAHLKSLSVELDKDDGLDDNIPEPPKTIESLKLYGGRVHKLLVWMKYFANLEKLHLTIEKPEDFRDPPELSHYLNIRHLRIRPIEDGELTISGRWVRPQVVEIQCSSKLHVKFDDPRHIMWVVKVLKVHLSGGSGSSLKISDLSRLTRLEEVWLKGYTDAHKQDMQRQISEMSLEYLQTRPVLKLVQPSSP